MFLQFALKTFKQCERVRSTTREPCDHRIIMQSPNLARVAFHSGITQCDLAIPTNHHLIASANRENGSAPHLGCAH